MKNPFLEYIMKDKKEDIFHSSAYGKAQSGNMIGATSSEPFSVRLNTEKNRQIIKNYANSSLISSIAKNTQQAKSFTKDTSRSDSPLNERDKTLLEARTKYRAEARAKYSTKMQYRAEARAKNTAPRKK